jgi:hypothetical protein
MISQKLQTEERNICVTPAMFAFNSRAFDARSRLKSLSRGLGAAVCSHTTSATTTAVVSDFGITSNPVPGLNIVPSGANAVLKWPVDSLGYKVQVTTNLAPAVWVNVTNAQSAVSGQFNVTAPANSSTKFYRLIQQRAAPFSIS